jgi:hypothetical protein
MFSSLKAKASRGKPQRHHPTSQKINRSIIVSFHIEDTSKTLMLTYTKDFLARNPHHEYTCEV